MRWKVHGRRTAYESSWINVHLDDVEFPDGRRFEHHVVTMPRRSIGTVVVDEDNNTLLIWRHRFITDRWGWEVPAGWADPGEDLAEAARREIVEETGWTVDHLDPLTEYNPLAGISDWNYTVFLGSHPRYVEPIADTSEGNRIEWVPLDQVSRLAAQGDIRDGPSLLMLTYYLSVRRPAG